MINKAILMGHTAENNPVNCFQVGLSNESCGNERKSARILTITTQQNHVEAVKIC